MENILMKFFREQKKYSAKMVALKLGISTRSYMELEKGLTLLTRAQSKQLGEIYGVPHGYFYKEAQQLDLLLTRMTIIRLLKWEKALLAERLEKKEVRSLTTFTSF